MSRHLRPSASAHRGFTLVELLIVIMILAILAAVVIPRFTEASQSARGSATLSQLRHIREQIARYKFDHNEQYPDLLTHQWQPLTHRTDHDGTINDAGKFGPYLTAPPLNPYTSSTTIAATQVAGNGWAYNPTSGVIAAVGFDETTQTYTEPQ